MTAASSRDEHRSETVEVSLRRNFADSHGKVRLSLSDHDGAWPARNRVIMSANSRRSSAPNAAPRVRIHIRSTDGTDASPEQVAAHQPDPGQSTGRSKGKIERVNRTVDQMLLMMLPGFTEGPRDLDGRLSGPLDDRSAARAGY